MYGHLDYFLCFAITKNVAMNNCAYIFLLIIRCQTPQKILRNGIERSKGRSIYTFAKFFQILFQKGYRISHFHQDLIDCFFLTGLASEYDDRHLKFSCQSDTGAMYQSLICTFLTVRK